MQQYLITIKLEESIGSETYECIDLSLTLDVFEDAAVNTKRARYEIIFAGVHFGITHLYLECLGCNTLIRSCSHAIPSHVQHAKYYRAALLSGMGEFLPL